MLNNTILLSLFYLLFLFSSCHNNESHLNNHYPYSENIILKNINIDRYKILHKNIESSVLDNIFISGDYFNIASNKNKNTFIFSKLDQRLYQIKNGKTILIAEEGNGPKGIQNGVRLVYTKSSLYLIQRHRVSSIKCRLSKCSLLVEELLPTSLSFFKKVGDERFLINDLHVSEGKKMIRIVDKDFETKVKVGDYFQHSNKSLVSYFNYSILSEGYDNKLYAQSFIFTPIVSLFDTNLNYIESFKIPNFYDHQISFRSNNDIKVNRKEKYSSIYGLYPLINGRFWIIVKNQKKNKGTMEEAQSDYDYYILDNSSGLHYSGSSRYFIIPHLDKTYFLKEGRIHVFDKNQSK